MSRTVFVKPGSLENFSVASIFASAIDRDWTEGYAEKWQEVFPPFTLGAIAEHAEELLSPEQAALAATSPMTKAPEDLADEFNQSDGYESFRTGFEPMMNFAWPVELGYEVEPQAAALLMAEFAPSCTLIERGEPGEEPSYEIALNGGGMNLADHIAGAYLCCGALPPVGILDSLSRCLPSYLLPRLPMVRVYQEARSFLSNKSETLTGELARILESQVETAERDKG
jgi:hypothetical protein